MQGKNTGMNMVNKYSTDCQSSLLESNQKYRRVGSFGPSIFLSRCKQLRFSAIFFTLVKKTRKKSERTVLSV